MACGPGRGLGRRRMSRKMTPLVLQQHVPNVSEKTIGASGPSEGKIKRDDTRFRELVPNYNEDIVFKDEEGTGADRLGTQLLKEKLDILAVSVRNQWPGIKLRVTEGWDEEDHHAADSLHYEGRAVDITTSDRDRSKYGMLARLAVEAGFTWVFYESRYHIHASVKSDKYNNGQSEGCFSGNSIVYTRSGPVQMSELRVGDEILSLASNGNLVFNNILIFMDRDPSVERVYYTVETETGKKITLTESHLIFVTKDSPKSSDLDKKDQIFAISRSLQSSKTIFARYIEPGMYIYALESTSQKTSKSNSIHLNSSIQRSAEHSNDSDINQFIFSNTIGDFESDSLNSVQLERVIRVTTTIKKGSYAPLTEQGNLIVNGILASCYAVVEDQSLAHLSFLPLRLWFNVVDSLNYIRSKLSHSKTPSFFKSASSQNLRSDNIISFSKKDYKSVVQPTGIHWYPKWLYKVAKYLINVNSLYS